MNKNTIIRALMSIVLTIIMVMLASQTALAKGDVFATISVGNWYSVAIKADGSLWAWGSNTFGQLGDGTNDDKNTPVKIMDNVSAVSAGGFHTMAIKTDGSLWAWGRNISAQLGDSSNENKKAPVKIMDDVLAVSAGGEHTVAIKTDGSLWTWGDNGDGQLGDGTNDYKSKPTKVMDDVTFISAGGSHTMAIKTDSSLWAWGWNINGQLGDGSINASNTPIKIMDDVSIVSAGFAYTMAIKKDNSLWAWASYTGQIISTANPYSKVPLKVMDDVSNVSTGSGYSMIIKTDGSLWTWGKNDNGQLGDGTNDDKDVIVKIMDDVSAVSGDYHTVAVKTDGSLWSWGSNEKGELGDGTNDNKNAPVRIMDDAMLPFNAPAGSASQELIEVVLNGEYIQFDQPPVIIDGRTLVPIRAVCEKLGADVYWLESAQLILVVKNDVKLGLTIGGNQMVKFTARDFSEYLEKAEDINFYPEEIYLDVPPQIIGVRTLLPIRSVCEALGAEVDWNGQTNTVVITCSEEIINDKNRDITFFDDLAALLENQIEELIENEKGEYSDFDYTAVIKISCSSDLEEYVAAREFIQAKVDSTNVGSHTMDLSKENLITITFGYNEGFDIDGFVANLMKESNLYFVDAANNIILDKTDIVDARSVWNGQTQCYDVEISLADQGQVKFAAATETMIGKIISIRLDDLIITSPKVMERIDSNKVVISGNLDSAMAWSLAYLIKAKGLPENIMLESVTNIKNIF